MREFVIRNDLTIHIQLSDPTADKLGCLRAEIKNNKFLVHANYYLIEWHKGRNNIRNLNHFSYLCVFIFNRNRMDTEKKETKEKDKRASVHDREV